MHGYNAMLEKIQPEKIICFGTPFDEMKGNIVKVDYIKSIKSGTKYTEIEEPDIVFENIENNDIISSSAIDLFGDIVEVE